MILAILISLPLFFSPICPADVVPCVSPNPPVVYANAIYLPLVTAP